MQLKILFPALVCCTVSVSFAQPALPLARNLQESYEKQTRTAAGSPGKNYWQNTADYDIRINFDPETRLLQGTVSIVYFNSSPDTLKQIWFKLYPNFYQKGNARLMPVDSADLTAGVKIDRLLINDAVPDDKERHISGTNMTVAIAPLSPGGQIKFDITYSYTLNKHSPVRTGEITPGADFVAYFFPRIAVYDDIDGWNKHPYLGNLEFYNDFCHFRAAITVPAGQVVWATGNLLNAAEVLSPACLQRLEQAEKNDAVITVIDSTEIKTATNRSAATNTWRFEADRVTDFVFACSDHYMWHSTSLVVDPLTGRRTRVDAVFNPVHKDYFNVIQDARKTVEAMSYRFPKWPFPYPHETVFDGLDQMEYPMMVNDNPVEDPAESVELTDHEIFHTLFPFYMGINETKYAWMDEGWATLGEWIISPMIDSSLTDEYGVAPAEDNAGTETDLPIMTLSTEISASYFTNSYPKPAMGYLFVKDCLGDELFYKGLHYYFREWNGRHPIPYDFFNCMNTGSGINMNWFWKKWFFDPGEPDLAITAVRGRGKRVVITSKGTKPVPVDLAVFFADNTSAHIHRSIAVWEKGNSSITVKIPRSQGKKITRLVLGSVYTPDTNKKDNEWHDE